MRIPSIYENPLAFPRGGNNFEHMLRFLIIFLIPASVLALEPLRWPENPRLLAMGSAAAALADDPQTGYSNAAGVRLLKKIGYDLSFATATEGGPDHYSAMLANPGTEGGSAFGLGVWTQGLSKHRDAIYYVSSVATAWNPADLALLGLTIRAPYLYSRVDSVDSRWETIGDLSILKTLGQARVGATVERAFGGAKDVVPRVLHAGAAFSSSGITLGYEWRAEETERRYDFHHVSSHWGAEAEIGEFVALRTGYIAGNFSRFTFGGAVGILKVGWRTQFGWDVPASGTGPTKWAVGLAYRL